MFRITTPRVLLMLSGFALVGALPSASFALPVPTSQVAESPASDSPVVGEAVTISDIAPVTLPDGARQTPCAGELVDLYDGLLEAAISNDGMILRSETLLWSGSAAKTVKAEISELLKAAGYQVVPSSSFDVKSGRVTAIAAMRGGPSDCVMGLWVEGGAGSTILIWGRFTPNAHPAPQAPAKVAKEAPRKSPLSAPAKRKAASRKTVAAAKPATARRKSRTQSDSERRAKAYKAYQDYQYVKLMGPISGPMYRSTKW